MSRKINWACSKCGETSGRRDSIRRHIGNKNIHDGNGTIIPIAEYYAGVNSGLYNPSIDRLINTKNRIRFDHQAPGQKMTSQEADPTGPNKRHSQVGKGGEIYLRRTIEGFADKIVENMTSDWKNKPIEYKLEVMAPFLKSYDLALAGELDLATHFEKHVVASRQADLLLEFVSLLNRGTTQSATKNNEVSNLKQEPQRENRPADIPKADATDNLKRDPPQVTVEQAGGVTSTKTIQQEDVRAEIAKLKQLLGKKPDQTITRDELFVGCTKFPEIGKIVLRLCRMEAADKGLNN